MADNLTVDEIIAKGEEKTRKLKLIEAEFDSTRSYFNCCSFIRFNIRSRVFEQYESQINSIKHEINNLHTQLDKQGVF